jgi:hypothetical protein
MALPRLTRAQVALVRDLQAAIAVWIRSVRGPDEDLERAVGVVGLGLWSAFARTCPEEAIYNLAGNLLDRHPGWIPTLAVLLGENRAERN